MLLQVLVELQVLPTGAVIIKFTAWDDDLTVKLLNQPVMWYHKNKKSNIMFLQTLWRDTWVEVEMHTQNTWVYISVNPQIFVDLLNVAANWPGAH